MGTIEELWFGNISPSEKSMPPGSPLYRATSNVVEAEQALEAELPYAKRKLLTDLENAQFESAGLRETEAFCAGFRLGMRLMIDVFSEA